MNKTTLDKSQTQFALMKPVNEIYKDAENKHERKTKQMIKYPINEWMMNQCLINEVVFSILIKNTLQAKLIDQLTGMFNNLQIEEFGYRQFLSNVTTMGFCT